MDLKLQDKSVIVTGASQGLGKAIATEFAREGAHVFISSRNEEKLQAAVADIKQETDNSNVHYVVCDVKEDDQIKTLIQTVIKENKTVDVLINNAGGPPAGSFLEISEDEWYDAFEQNLLSVVRATKQALPYMKEQQSGRIVNITSSSIQQSIDNLILSNTMRPGVLGLTNSLAQEFASDNILVNTVGPGKVETGRIVELNELAAKAKGIPYEEMRTKDIAQIPSGRYGEPAEFAKAVVFLASFANTYITGQSLIVDGGAVKAL